MHILRDILLRFTTAAFLLQLMVPFYAVYGVSASHAQMALENPAQFGEKVLICTSNGFEYVSWEALANDEGLGRSQHTNMKCPTCYVHAKAMDAAKPVVMPLYVAPAAQKVAIARDAYVAYHVVQQQHARAPPVV